MARVRREVAACGDEHIGTGHMLLACFEEPTGPLPHVLAALALEGEQVRERVLDRLGRRPALPLGSRGQLAVTPGVKRVLEVSLEEARRLGCDEQIDPVHLFLALIVVRETVAGQILASCGVDPEAARRQVVRSLGEPPAGANEIGA
jgi:ATP-dependent Clp protease ATP-binding subunit ClpA